MASENETAKTALVYDASGAKKGADDIQAASEKIIKANRDVEQSSAKTASAVERDQSRMAGARRSASKEAEIEVEATKRQVSGYQSLERSLDSYARKYDPLSLAVKKARDELKKLEDIATAATGTQSTRAKSLVDAARQQLQAAEIMQQATAKFGGPGNSALRDIAQRYDVVSSKARSYGIEVDRVSRILDANRVSEADRARILNGVAVAYGMTTKAADQHNASLAKVQAAVGGLSSGYATAIRAAGAFGITLGVAGLVTYAKHVMDTVGGLGELSEQLGLSTDSLQIYEYHAVQAGIKQEEFRNVIQKFTRTIGEAAAGDDKAVKSFNDLGVVFVDVTGKARETDAILVDVAKKISEMEDPTARAAAVVEFFGRSGQKLLPTLSALAENGFPALADAAKNAGAVVDKELIDRFDKASDAFARWGKRIVVFSAEMIGAIADIADKTPSLLDKAIAPWENYFKRLGNLYMDWLGSPFAKLLRGDNPFGKDSPKTVLPGNWPSVPFGDAPPKPATSAPAASNPLSDSQKAQEVSLRKYIEALEDEAKAIRMGDAERAVSKALREAESKLIDNQGKVLRTLTDVEKERIRAAANAPLANQATRALEETNAAAEGHRRVAAAMRESEAQSKAVEAQTKAEADARKNANVVIAEASLAYRNEASARAVLDATKVTKDISQQAVAQGLLSQATLKSVEAAQEQARQNQVDAAFREKLATAIGKDKDLILDEKAAYDLRSKAILADQQLVERSIRLRNAEREVTQAAAKARLAMIADPAQRQAMEQAIERQQRLNELTDQYGEDLEQINKNMALFDQAQAFKAQENYWNQVRDLAEDTSKDIKQFMLDGIVSVEKGGKSAFKSLWESALAGGKRMFYNLALEVARQKFIMPIVTQIIGSNSSMFGIAQPQGAQAAGFNPMQLMQTAGQVKSGMDFMSNPFSSISNLFSPDNFIANAFPGLFGSVAGYSSGAVAASTAASIAEMAPVGAFASGAGPGMLAGVAPFLPALAIALPLLLSFFMGGKKSVGPNSNAIINFERDANGALTNPGGLAIGGLGADNGGNKDYARKMAEAATKTFNTIVDRIGGRVRSVPGAGLSNQLELGVFEEGSKHFSIVNGVKAEFSSAEEAVADFARRTLQAATIDGLSPDVKLALEKSVASSVEELGKDVDFAYGFRRQVDLAAAGPGTREAQLLGFKYAGQDFGSQQRIATRDFMANARRLFGEDSTQYADAQVASRQMLLNLMDPGPTRDAANAPLEGMAAQVAEVSAKFQGLKEALIDTGLSAEQAQEKIDEGIRKTFRRVADDQEKAVADSILAAVSPGALNARNLSEAQRRRRNDYIDAHRAAGDTDISLAGLNQLDRIEAGAAMLGLTRQQLAEVEAELIRIGDTSAGMRDALRFAREFATMVEGFGQRSVDIARWNMEEQKDQKAISDATSKINDLKSTYISLLESETGAINDQIKAAEQARSTWQSLADTMRSTRLGLLTDPNLSPLSLENRLAEARSQVESAYTASKTGSEADRIKAAGTLPTLIKTFLEASKEFNRGGAIAGMPTYNDDFNRASAILAATEDMADFNVRSQTNIINSLNSSKTILENQLDVARETRTGITSIAEASAALVAAQEEERAAREAAAANAVSRGSAQFAAFQSLANVFNQLYGRAASQAERDQIYSTVATQRDALLGSISDIATLQRIGQTYYQGNNTDSGAIFLRSRLFSLGAIPNFEKGGFHKGGLALVGERGPELAMFGAPSRIFPANDTASFLSSSTVISMDLLRELRDLKKQIGELIKLTGRIGGATVTVLEEGIEETKRAADGMKRSRRY
jgi:hypothetical protein